MKIRIIAEVEVDKCDEQAVRLHWSQRSDRVLAHPEAAQVFFAYVDDCRAAVERAAYRWEVCD